MEWLVSLCWAALLLVFLAVEGMTVGLVSIWFALGALGGLITSALTNVIWVQVVVFLVVSLVALIALRPLAGKLAKGKKEATNADRYVGREGVVIQRIHNLSATGQVKVDGSVWSARTEGEEPIEEGSTVRVLRIEGVKLIVSPVPSLSGERR